ncbi:hypothetical protein B0H14DRAFT_3651292 [Mycena olivaceomarginata]|nr:hypothetical protein B0H14DRAFT_3651292 [Mycena olivaceomarginata]
MSNGGGSALKPARSRVGSNPARSVHHTCAAARRTPWATAPCRAAPAPDASGSHAHAHPRASNSFSRETLPSPREPSRAGAQDEDMEVEFEVPCEEEDVALSGRSNESDLERLRCTGKWRKGGSLGAPSVGSGYRKTYVRIGALLVKIDNDTAAEMAWINLKEVLKAMRNGSDLCPALKEALDGVTETMDSIDRVGDVDDEFVTITDNVKGFQGIFSQYGSEKDISPAMHSSLDAVTSSVIAALSTAASPDQVSRELKLIEEAIGSKTERGRARRALEAPDDVDKVASAFKRLGNMINGFQRDMGLLTRNYHMNVFGTKEVCWMSKDYSLCPGGVGGAGGMSKGGTGGNGGVGQGPTLDISATNCTVNILSTGSATVPDSPAQI